MSAARASQSRVPDGQSAAGGGEGAAGGSGAYDAPAARAGVGGEVRGVEGAVSGVAGFGSSVESEWEYGDWIAEGGTGAAESRGDDGAGTGVMICYSLGGCQV